VNDAPRPLLRRQLAELRDRDPQNPFGRILDDVLRGRRSLRDAARTPEWDAAITPAAATLAEHWAQLSDAQREAVLRESCDHA
jgi:hypothetical protein